MPRKQTKKAEYDRKYQKNVKYPEYRATKLKVVTDLFGGVCFTCESSTNPHTFHFHHIIYDAVGSNYKRTGQSMSLRWTRLLEAQSYPERFRLLCPTCHMRVTSIARSIRTARNKPDPDLMLQLVRLDIDNQRP